MKRRQKPRQVSKSASRAFAFSCFLFSLFGCATPSTLICKNHVQFKNPNRIGFNDNERIFLCGDLKVESWKEIPLSQSEFTLKNFLRQRAFYKPNFTYADEILTVDEGPQTFAEELVYSGEPPGFNDIEIRDILHHPLTSSLLDTIEGFTLSRLKNMGYACPEVKVNAVIETGKITVKITPGPFYRFLEPEVEDPIHLYPKTMRRFDAFQLDAPYRYELTKLSSNRAENDGIVVSSQFSYDCPASKENRNSEKGLILNQRLIGGDKRLITIGVGASTEEFPIGQVTWKSVRLDDRGSNLKVSLYGSNRTQKIQSTFIEYLFKNAPRFDLAPTLSYVRNVESTYTSTKLQFSNPIEYKGDAENHAWLVSFGPSVSRIFSEENFVQKTENFFSFLGRLSLMSHLYELYQTDPKSGYTIDLNAEALYQHSLTPLATVLNLSGTHLFQLNFVEPAQWLMGIRYGASTTFTDEDPRTTSLLPATYFHSLGGDASLRGFGRNQLTEGTIGVRSAAYLGTEVRYAKTLPFGIEPFVFIDGGELGYESLALDNIFYYSPGAGVRLSTPFGAIRTTFAHGYSVNSSDPALSHFQFFISFGQEF